MQEKNIFKIIFTSEAARQEGEKALQKYQITNEIWQPNFQNEKKKKMVIVKEIPLGTLKEEVLTAMEEFGKIEECHMQIVGICQKVKITYE